MRELLTSLCLNHEELDWRLKVFDSLSYPTLILRPDRVVISANKKVRERFGSDVEAIRGKTCHEIFYKTKKPCAEDVCPLKRLLKTGEGHSTIRRVIDEKGREIWEDRVFSPILDDSGKVAYILESIRDVTRFKTLEMTLNETKDFLEKLIRSSPSAIVAADRPGNLLLMNPAAEDLFGFTLVEAKGAKTVRDLYPPHKAREIMSRLRSAGHGGKGKLATTKLNILDAKGEEIPVEMTASILYEREHEVGTMGIYNDLRGKLAVERRLQEAQEQLAQSEKMASMGQLAAGVAHEINNPLTGILFYASMAQERLSNDDPLYRDLQCIVEDVNRCKEIVKNLLAYSRRSEARKDILDVNHVVEQSLMLIRDQRLFGNVVVEKRFTQEMMLVYADNNQICQVIINLLLNALAAMEGEGQLTLTTCRDKPLRKAYVEVRDTGCGIPQEYLSKIFDPFFTTKEPGKGTGLGLSTAYGIVQETGGQISVRETGPGGTTFLLELPLYVPSDSETADGPSSGHFA